MRPAPLRPAAAVSTAAAQPQRYLTNDEAADYLRLSPRTLEKVEIVGNEHFGVAVRQALGEGGIGVIDRQIDDAGTADRRNRQKISGPRCNVLQSCFQCVGRLLGVFLALGIRIRSGEDAGYRPLDNS